MHVHGAPQAVEGLHVVHNLVSMAIATLSVCFKRHSNFDADVKEHVSHIKFPIFDFVRDSLFMLLELDLQIFLILSLTACLLEKAHDLEEVHGHLWHAKIKELAVAKFHNMRILCSEYYHARFVGA